MCVKLLTPNQFYRKFGWSSCSQIKFNPGGSLLFISGACKVRTKIDIVIILSFNRQMIRMNAVEIGEMVVYQVRGRNMGEIRSRISLR